MEPNSFKTTPPMETQATTGDESDRQLCVPKEGSRFNLKKWILWGFVALVCVLSLIAGVTAKDSLEVHGEVLGEDYVVKSGNFIMILKHVQAGSFMMGSPESEVGRNDDERLHNVTITKDFWLGETEVTQAQWKAIMGKNPAYFQGNDRPVDQVGWVAAMEFCKKLTMLDSTLPEGYEYTLPTEAQWEYAARGGHKNSGYQMYSGSNKLEDVAWYYDNSKRETQPVGRKCANILGLYDMNGNVWEWCRDCCMWDGDLITDTIKDGILDPYCHNGSYSGRIKRGGSWYCSSKYCRVAERDFNNPAVSDADYGFRVALAPIQ